jgi:hypothetical protein
MPKWTEYTTKDTLADNDEVMLYDATARANKRGLMSKFWNYVVDKMATAVISKLETNNKTIIGAINALNSETGKMYVNYNETDLNELYSTIQTISACVCPPNTPNIPEQSTGFAITIKYDSNAQMQIYIAINKKIYIRNSNLEWTKL